MIVCEATCVTSLGSALLTSGTSLQRHMERLIPPAVLVALLALLVTNLAQRRRRPSAAALRRHELAHASRVSAMGELAGSLAHELNQPLTAILSNVQAAQRFMASGSPESMAEVRDILADVVEETDRASEVIRRMRALVRKGELEVAPTGIEHLVRDVAILVHSDAIVRGVRLTMEVEPELPPVVGDRVQLQQVALNLLLNAFDAVRDLPPRERLVTVQVGRDGAACVRVSVRDNGAGLTGEKLERIFKPFFTTKREGLGLGLSISRSIVEAHGGRLWAERNRGQGATFHFTLPAVAS